MAEYYGVTRSNKYFAHYGVKGMRWGVRKARESGNDEALTRHYNKAQKKLRKLSERADVEVQRKKYNDWNGQAGKAALAGGIGGALGGGANALYNVKKSVINAAKSKYGFGYDNDMSIALQKIPAYKYLADLNARKIVGIGVATGATAAALGAYTGKKIRAHVYKNRMTPEGHAKAVAKRDAWSKEMKSAFKGTKYANKMKQDQKIEQGMKNWANAFEKHYQTGLSRGMTHEQAERYSNDYIAKNGFKPVSNKKKRR